MCLPGGALTPVRVHRARAPRVQRFALAVTRRAGARPSTPRLFGRQSPLKQKRVPPVSNPLSPAALLSPESRDISPSKVPARFGPLHWGALVLSVVPLMVYAVSSPRLGDLALYAKVVHAFLGGAVPNVDFRFEYPPYALLWFVPAGWLGAGEHGFGVHFSLQLTLLDATIKWLLLYEGARWGRTWRAWQPFVLYSLASYFQSIHYLKRYDLIPAVLTVAALVALARRREAWAGAGLAVGVVTKLYPVVLVPFALLWCLRRGSLRRFVVGGVLGLLPLVPISALWPWWRFASFHVERGLQVESLWANLLWTAHLLGWTNPRWILAPAAYELAGPEAKAVLVVARYAWVAGTGLCVAVGLRAVWRRPVADVASLARVALAPLVAFVILNPVLSPQYLIWLTGVAGLALYGAGPVRAPLAIFAAAALSRYVFAGSTYDTGLGWVHTVILLVRNGLLLWAGVELVRELWRNPPVTPAREAGEDAAPQATALAA